MSEGLNEKIIELESKFSLLIKKYNNLKIENRDLNQEITEKEIDIIIKKYQIKNQNGIKDPLTETNHIKEEIDSTINEIDNLIHNLKK
ncbi:MAG: hypothetical protein ACJZ0Y_07110 [Cytophagales bacterium]|nr:MAG: hypothetical protein CND83_00850 [Rhodothermaeota bacterium MED-G19]